MRGGALVTSEKTKYIEPGSPWEFSVCGGRPASTSVRTTPHGLTHFTAAVEMVQFCGPLHKGAVLQPSGSGRAFKGLGVAKRYCRRNSLGDTFMQCGSAMRAYRAKICGVFHGRRHSYFGACLLQLDGLHRSDVGVIEVCKLSLK